jgi:hypothetical protein
MISAFILAACSLVPQAVQLEDIRQIKLDQMTQLLIQCNKEGESKVVAAIVRRICRDYPDSPISRLFRVGPLR